MGKKVQIKKLKKIIVKTNKYLQIKASIVYSNAGFDLLWGWYCEAYIRSILIFKNL